MVGRRSGPGAAGLLWERPHPDHGLGVRGIPPAPGRRDGRAHLRLLSARRSAHPRHDRGLRPTRAVGTNAREADDFRNRGHQVVGGRTRAGSSAPGLPRDRGQPARARDPTLLIVAEENPIGGRLRSAVRGGLTAGLVGTDHATSVQPRRVSAGERCPLPGRPGPGAVAPADDHLHDAPPRERHSARGLSASGPMPPRRRCPTSGLTSIGASTRGPRRR